MYPYQADPEMQQSELPPESRPPNDFPPSSGLPPGYMPPDAMNTLIGGPPPMPGQGGSGGGMQGGGEQYGGGQGPNGEQAGMGGGGMGGGGGMPGADQGMFPGMSSGVPQPDPMMAVRDQFMQATGFLKMMAESYPMATQEFQECGEALARAMLKIAEAVQPQPMAPPVPA